MSNILLGFDIDLLNKLQDIESIPQTEPNAVPGIPGRLFIIAPEQREQLEQIVKTLDNLPSEYLTKMSSKEMMFYSTLLNNAEVVLKNSISRPTRNNYQK